MNAMSLHIAALQQKTPKLVADRVSTFPTAGIKKAKRGNAKRVGAIAAAQLHF
jgi:hypothetical protein